MVDMKRLAWALARLDIWSDPYKHDLDIPTLCMMEEEEVDALATKKAFLYEAQANHLNAAMQRFDLDANPELAAQLKAHADATAAKIAGYISGECKPEPGGWDDHTLETYRGHTMEDCKAKFDNIGKFSGFPSKTQA